MSPGEILPIREAAERIGVSVNTLKDWRRGKRGPAWQTNPDTGKCIGYRQQDVDAWLNRGHVEASR